MRRRAALIAVLVAVVVPTAAAAIWVGAPDEVESPQPSTVSTTSTTTSPATGTSTAPGEESSGSGSGSGSDAVRAPAPGERDDPHAERLPPAERTQLIAAVADVNESAEEADLVAEGRVLFRSTDVAKDGESCQSCHTDGGANHELGTMTHPTAADDFTGPRDSQPLWGVEHTAPYRWDGGIPTLTEMAGATIDNHFKPEQRVDVPRKTAALVAYMNTLDAPLTAYDRGRMSAAALRGQAIFDGKGGCAGCHGGPLFTDNRLHVTGVPQAPGANDPGATRPAGAFSTQQLRDLRNTAPYMHNGTIPTLREVIEFYEDTSTVPGIDLTEDETDDLIEYLESL